jgi:hypothetical protein
VLIWTDTDNYAISVANNVISEEVTINRLIKCLLGLDCRLMDKIWDIFDDL